MGGINSLEAMTGVYCFDVRERKVSDKSTSESRFC